MRPILESVPLSLRPLPSPLDHQRAPNDMDSSISDAAVPPELLRPIFEYLQNDKVSLCAVSLSSSAFRQEAQRILFQDVIYPPQNTETHRKFLRAVVSSSRLALLVRSYKPCYCTKTDREILDLMRAGLEAMKNLTCLDLSFANRCGSVESTPFTDTFASIMRRCTFSLQHLDWSHGPFGPNRGEFVEKFMSRQDTLKYLSLVHFGCPCMRNARPVFATKCPHLVSLEGDWEVVKDLLPGRKITRLSIISSYANASAADIRSRIPELKRIAAFSYTPLIRPIAEEMEGLLHHCPSVTVFELGDFRQEDHEALLSMLHKFPGLRSVILSRRRPHQESLEEHQIRHLFEISVNLQYIDIQIDMESDTYARYTRNQVFAPQDVSKNEVRKLWLVE